MCKAEWGHGGMPSVHPTPYLHSLNLHYYAAFILFGGGGKSLWIGLDISFPL